MARTTVYRGGGAQTGVAVVETVSPLATEFEALFQRHHRDVYRYVLALTRSHADADDITAETFERALRSAPTSGLPVERALPWLLLTARRITTDRWRRLRRLGRLGPLVRGGRDDGIDLRKSEFWLWFDALCEALPERQREVLVLRYHRDLSDADIALVMDLTASGVRSLVARALESLRRHPEVLA